jgi:hypothetical protein
MCKVKNFKKRQIFSEYNIQELNLLLTDRILQESHPNEESQ